jgi:signal peptidase I
MTAVAAPMVHDTLPVVNTTSYLKKPQIPYLRIPGFQKIKRNDIVVFNWPADTLFNMYIAADKKYEKPIDKKTNYVKRCVGIAGDSLEIRDGYVFINGKQTVLPDRAKTQFYYTVISKKILSAKYLKEEIGTTEYNRFYVLDKKTAINRYRKIANLFKPFPNDSTKYLIEFQGDFKPPNDFKATDRYSINMSDEEQKKLRENSNIVSVKRNTKPKGEKDDRPIFPSNKNGVWNGDNMGPIYIPEAGKTVQLNKEVLPLYKDIISEYEGNKLSTDGHDIYINGKIATSYTFKQDYYWMMGDNRQNSLDARYWGYVPFDHVVGKPVFVWMSISGVELGLKNFKNWVFNKERIFTTVGGSGKPVSYLPYFLILLVIWQGYKFYKKKKATNEEE